MARFFVSEHVEAFKYCIRKIGSIFAFLLDYSCIESTQCIPSSCKCFKAIKKRHPASSHIVHEALQNLNLQLEFLFETTSTTSTNYFLGTPPCWREHQPPFPFQKNTAGKLVVGWTDR